MDASASLVGRTRDYVAVWQRDGLDAFLDLVPDDIELVPFSAGGRRLWGKESIRDFWRSAEARGQQVELQLGDVELLDEDNVLVTGTLIRRSGATTAVVPPLRRVSVPVTSTLSSSSASTSASSNSTR